MIFIFVYFIVFGVLVSGVVVFIVVFVVIKGVFIFFVSLLRNKGDFGWKGFVVISVFCLVEFCCIFERLNFNGESMVLDVNLVMVVIV